MAISGYGTKPTCKTPFYCAGLDQYAKSHVCVCLLFVTLMQGANKPHLHPYEHPELRKPLAVLSLDVLPCP